MLYDDGTFALQYSTAKFGFIEYRGTYTDANAVTIFEWEVGWSALGAWGACGSMSADSLDVRYNVAMQGADFEDGVYVRAK